MQPVNRPQIDAPESRNRTDSPKRKEPAWPAYDPAKADLFLDDLAETDRIVIEQLEQGGVQLSWPAANTSDRVALYRVFSDQQAVPYEPDSGDWSDWTEGEATLIDLRELGRGVRHYSVWCHHGATREAAINATPSPVATGSLVAAVEDMEIWETGGAVKGRWHPVEPQLEVRIVRVTKGSGVTGQIPQKVIGGDLLNRSGFTDPEPPRGMAATYRVWVQFKAKYWVEQSVQNAKRIEVSAVLTPVELVVSKRWANGTRPLVDISWANPQMGWVDVYATQEAPPPDLTEKISDATAFARVETFSNVKALPDQPAGPDQYQRMSITGVDWPVDGESLWLTPVTKGRDSALRVGKSVYLSYVKPVTQVRLSERLSGLRLTFDWPRGADAVRTVLAPADAETADPKGAVAKETSLLEYNEDGGQLLPWSEVLGEPKRIFVYSGDYSNKVFRPTKPLIIDYPGIRRIGYSIVWQSAKDGSLEATVEVWSDKPSQSVNFVLISRFERLPLDRKDGVKLAGSPVRGTQPQNKPTDLSLPSGSIGPEFTQRAAWKFSLPQDGGYVRLFALPNKTDRLPPIALIDPPLEQLHPERKGNVL